MASANIRGALNVLGTLATVDPGPSLLSAMQPVKTRAVQFTPVDTGVLAASVGLILDRSGTKVTLCFGATGGRLQKRLAIEFGNRFVAPQMPLRRAVEGSETAVRIRFEVLYRRAVRSQTRIRTIAGRPVPAPRFRVVVSG